MEDQNACLFHLSLFCTVHMKSYFILCSLNIDCLGNCEISLGTLILLMLSYVYTQIEQSLYNRLFIGYYNSVAYQSISRTGGMIRQSISWQLRLYSYHKNIRSCF